MRKKGQGISLTTIIIAAIALLVLIVLIAIFAGRINIFGKGYDDTSTSTQSRVCGGACVADAVNCPANTNPDYQGDYIDCSMVCCKRIAI